MRRSKALLAGITAVAIALVAGAYVATMARPARPSLPDVSIARLFAAHLDDSNGKPQKIDQWRGKTLVINFWASWCPPCREEMPAFSRLQTKYAANGVQFVGIALDNAHNVIKFTQQHPVSYPLLVGDSQAAELTQQLGNTSQALPYTVVIAPAGDVRLTRLGRVAEQELDTLLASMTRHK